MSSPARLRFDLQSLDLLSIGLDRSVGNRVDTYRYIPGTVVRGALAAAWFVDHDPANSTDRDAFIEIFEGATIFGLATPDGARIEPLSVARCKYQPEPDCWRFAEDLAENRSTGLPQCTYCQGQTVLGKGQMLGVQVVERTRTALEKGTAKEGSLFTRTALNPGTTFSAEIIAADAEVAAWLKSVANTTMWVGGGLSTGGRVAIRSVTEVPESLPDGLGAGEPTVLRLGSPAILADAATRPVTRFTPEILGEALGAPIRINRQWVRVERVGGWNVVAGTPKPQEVALAAGSTVRLVPDEPVPAKRVAAFQNLGIGLRRNEGFGRVVVGPHPWEPPAPRLPQQGSTSEAMNVVWELARVGLVDEPAVANAVGRVAAAAGEATLESVMGRDHWRHFDKVQKVALEHVGHLERPVLADVAVCLEEHQSDAGSNFGEGR